MIVVDTNVIAYLFVQGDRTAQAEAVLNKDSDWTAPFLWRSEFRNVLAFHMRQGHLSLPDAKLMVREAETLMNGEEYEVGSDQILALAAYSKLSARDCEFVALAMNLSVKLATSDKRVLTAFPDSAVSIEMFTA